MSSFDVQYNRVLVHYSQRVESHRKYYNHCQSDSQTCRRLVLGVTHGNDLEAIR